MAEWWSIEVFHGGVPAASQWQDSYSSTLIESAISHGAVGWAWIEHRYGVVFEVRFPDDAQWEAFRALPAVRAALDAVPDPVNGLLVYRGRGGGSGAALAAAAAAQRRAPVRSSCPSPATRAHPRPDRGGRGRFRARPGGRSMLRPCEQLGAGRCRMGA